jgi:fructose-bisphosphate aldolase class 1
MIRTELARIANAMVAKNKGILAADESTGTADQETQAA